MSVGIEFKPRELPSKLQMMKLAMNRRFIFAFKECMVELEKAGVDFTSEVCDYKFGLSMHAAHVLPECNGEDHVQPSSGA